MKGIARKLRNSSLITELFIFSETQVNPRNEVVNGVEYDICVRVIIPTIMFYCSRGISPLSHSDVNTHLDVIHVGKVIKPSLLPWGGNINRTQVFCTISIPTHFEHKYYSCVETNMTVWFLRRCASAWYIFLCLEIKIEDKSSV